MITHLPAVEIEGHVPWGLGGPEHPMRKMTRRAAGLDGDAGAWDAEARTAVAQIFDALAGDWHTRTSPSRTEVVADVLERGVAADAPHGPVVEVGSGIGTYTRLLAQRFGGPVLALDLSLEMLKLASDGRVQADAAAVPLADGNAAAVVLINAFLFPAEVDRVLAPDGVVVWVNSSGEETPIHLPPDEVAEVLPGEWEGVASRAGVGIWCVLRRASPS